MKINTALILCAGFGKRLNPLTLDTPKPLIELNNVSVLETCINLIESLDIKEIFINTFYLKDQIHNFINKKNFKPKISIIDDGKNILDTGGLVSDEIIGELIKNRLTQSDCINGSLFDGVPRTLGQAAELKNMGINFTHVIEIQVDDEVIVRRMSGRRVHPGSGKNYHIDFNPPQIEGKDDETGEPLIQREDDKPETVLKRLAVYHDQTKPLSDFYSNQALESNLKYITVDGSQSVDDVFNLISSQI